MMKTYSFAFLLLLFFIITCTSSHKASDAKENALFNKWLGHSKSQLVKTWGQPDSTIADGKHGEILIYKERVDYKSVMNSNYTGKEYSFRKQMYVNQDSVIYYWKTWRRK